MQVTPWSGTLTHLVDGIATGQGSPDLYQRLKARLAAFYGWLVGKRWFRALLFAYLALMAVTGVVWAAVLVASTAAGASASLELDFWGYGLVVSSSVTGVFVVVGFFRWRRSRLAAFRWFERALLVAIFVTQFFSFYEYQTSQAFGLVIVLLTYAAVRGMTAQEEARLTAQGVGAAIAGG